MRLNAFIGLGQIFEQLNKCFDHNPNAGSANANQSCAGEDDNFIAVEIIQGRAGTVG
jgi:hypothetical protein